jgi:sugar lactone lactonase YvrE
LVENQATPRRGWTRGRIVAAVVVLAFLLRLWAAAQLPTDFDEPIYVENGFDYAELIHRGDLNTIVTYPENREHPALVKILYGVGILALGEDASWSMGIFASRLISVIFGTLAVLIVALLNPLAGGLLAVHTLVVKYTSQAYLEALPHFASLAAIFFFLQFSRPRKQEEQKASKLIPASPPGMFPRSAWFWLSAFFLGMTAAGKYAYLPVLFVIVYLGYQASRQKVFHFSAYIPYFLFAGFTFWLLNPPLWTDPLNNLWHSLNFHTQYSQSLHVMISGYRWYQPLIWIAHSTGFQWHPDIFFYIGFDGLIFLFAAVGMVLEWRKRRWVVVWIAICLIFLLVWPTKWPQYTMVVIPALCLSAAASLQWIYGKLMELEDYYGTLSILLPRPPRAFWIMIASVILVLFVGFILNSISVVLGRIGWSQVTVHNSFLPSQGVNEIYPTSDGWVIIGSDGGAAFWAPSEASDLPDTWVVYTTSNSGLPHNRVLSIAQDDQGRAWFGTQSGLARFDGQDWQVFQGPEIGLESGNIHALETGSLGSLWVGTSSGAAVFDGQGWTSFTEGTSGLASNSIFSLAVQPGDQGDLVWFGTLGGVSRLDTGTGDWMTFTSSDFGTHWGSTASLTLDSQGRLWAATLGGGLNVYDGVNWTNYRTANTDLPYNHIQEVLEVQPGVVWVGVSIPNTTGGMLVSYDGNNWRIYNPSNSGYSGSQPTALAVDESGRIWIGTRTSGIDLFQVDR